MAQKPVVKNWGQASILGFLAALELYNSKISTWQHWKPALAEKIQMRRSCLGLDWAKAKQK